MTDRPTIVHVIDDLGRGGAETLLVDLLKELTNHYNVILVTLRPGLDFDPSEIKCQYRYILNYNYVIQFPLAVRRLNKIIRKHKPVLVRSQLYWSTVIARLACPKNVPLVFSLHVTQSDETFNRRPKARLQEWIEKRTYKGRQLAIGVTQEVIDDYDKTIGLRGKHYVLYNYVNDAYFSNSIDYVPPANGKLRMVAVGNVKRQKNYNILIDALAGLNNPNVLCDIYGREGNKSLQEEINKRGVSVSLKGVSTKVYEQLKKYDAFIMCSIYEGFGISVAEAMATGLPLFLSDLKVLREISHNNAIFFDPYDKNDLEDKIRRFKNGEYDTITMSKMGKEISKKNYTRKAYIEKLMKIYDEVITTGQ